MTVAVTRAIGFVFHAGDRMRHSHFSPGLRFLSTLSILVVIAGCSSPPAVPLDPALANANIEAEIDASIDLVFEIQSYTPSLLTLVRNDEASADEYDDFETNILKPSYKLQQINHLFDFAYQMSASGDPKIVSAFNEMAPESLRKLQEYHAVLRTRFDDFRAAHEAPSP